MLPAPPYSQPLSSRKYQELANFAVPWSTAHNWVLNFSLCISNITSGVKSLVFFVVVVIVWLDFFGTQINASFFTFLLSRLWNRRSYEGRDYNSADTVHSFPSGKEWSAVWQTLPIRETGKGCQVNLAVLEPFFTRIQFHEEMIASSESMNTLLSLPSHNPFNCCLILMKCGWY